jgi:hypothetical protein
MHTRLDTRSVPKGSCESPSDKSIILDCAKVVRTRHVLCHLGLFGLGHAKIYATTAIGCLGPPLPVVRLLYLHYFYIILDILTLHHLDRYKCEFGGLVGKETM